VNISKQKSKIQLIQEILASRKAAWENQLKRFIPELPHAEATDKQVEFFSDTSYYRLLKAGNRTGKTFSTTRDMAWKLCRTHPYRGDFNCVEYCKKSGLRPLDIFDAYMQTKPKVFWILGPDYSFLDDTLWKMYLKQMIPSWFYTDDDGKENITYTQQGNISEIQFRNGDILQFKSYAQRILSLMGRKIDQILIDEMPPHLQTLTELMMRLQDTGGEMTMGFTPLVTCDDVKQMLESHPSVRIHTWMIYDNPLYRDNPEKLRRFIEDLGSMPKNELDARLNGEWYYELAGGLVYAGLQPTVVEPFDIPLSWRRARVADPAISSATGYSEYAEDPRDGTWYCYKALEFQWSTAVNPELLIKTLEDLRPYHDYPYLMSIYDNAENWFGFVAPHWSACMHKNREIAIKTVKDLVAAGKVRFFKGHTELLLGQLANYKTREDGSIVKKNDHCLDTLHYFCRQIPPYDPTLAEERPSLQREIVMCALRQATKPDTVISSNARQRPKFGANRAIR